MLLQLKCAEDGWPVYVESKDIILADRNAANSSTSLVISNAGAIRTIKVKESPVEIDSLCSHGASVQGHARLVSECEDDME